MSYSTWTHHAVSSNTKPWQSKVWRVVESQHIASTMKLVDSYAEQDVLEKLLDTSKPILNDVLRSKNLHYLLETPFRYPPRKHGSRFRGAFDPGVFYGAMSTRTACAELGYWRWRFLIEAQNLNSIEPLPHTAFSVEISTTTIDLRSPPFNTSAVIWENSHDYQGTQGIATLARTADVGGIIYKSVRDPQSAWCLALLTPSGFLHSKPDKNTKNIFLGVTLQGVSWRGEQDSYEFRFSR